MSKNHELVDVECIYRFVTDKALAVNLDPDDIANDKVVFLPLSQIEWKQTGKRERIFYDVIRVTLPEWLAVDKGMV